jgi:hypothetical protein
MIEEGRRNRSEEDGKSISIVYNNNNIIIE